MTTLKIQGRPSASAAAALQPHVQAMYDRVGTPWIAIVELAQSERTEPAPTTDKDRSVQMRIIGAEVATDDHAGTVREVMRALYVMRTATGTLTEEDDVALSRQTLADVGTIVQLQAIARLSAGITHWADYLGRVASSSKLTIGELRHEVDAVRDGMLALVNRQMQIETDEEG
jgi:hypothetical protein